MMASKIAVSPGMRSVLVLCLLISGGTTSLPSEASAQPGAAPCVPVASPASLQAATPPRPDHVVILIEENHDYSQIDGSAQAPYINALKSQGAWFTNSRAIEHPSQPNYLDLYSGSNQGVTDDTVPPPTMPVGGYTVANLGGGLKAKGFTFGGYSETLPSVGSTASSAGTAPNTYQRKHNPWVDWQGTGANQIPSAWNMPFQGSFPTDFTQLPAVSIVVPNQENDMHDGSISTGDSWARNNLDAYAQWAKTHNSLFILTFDENDGTAGNHIVTVFIGQMVTIGSYGENIDHYTLLRTIEDMYGLTHAGAAASASPIVDCWTAASPVSPSITAQPANQTVTVGQTATFSVSATGTGPLSYQWQKNGMNIAGATSASYSTPTTALSDSGSTFRAMVTNSVGTATSNLATLTVNPSMGGALPAPWVDQDIGAVGAAGSASYSAGTFDVCGAGADIWNSSDGFHFAYQTLTGDGSIIAHVMGMGSTNAWAKAGVMIRETLAPDSRYADMVLTPSNGAAFQRRTTTGGAGVSTAGPIVTVPDWVKLDRTGNTFTASASPDGAMWTVVGTDTITMATAYIGLAVTSHDTTVTNCAMMDLVSGTGGWQPPSSGGGPPPSGGGGGGCGATGAEVGLLLGLLWVWRRRRC